DRTQRNYHYGTLEFAYPEAREYVVDQIVRLMDEYEFDGVYLCTRTHSQPAEHADRYGFNQPVVDEFQRRYGVNILAEDFDLESWRRLRGEYFVQLYREIREALPDRQIATGIPRGRYLGPPHGNMYLDWETLCTEKLVDLLVIGVYSGRGLYPKLTKPHVELGYLSSDQDGLSVPDWREAVNEVYGPVCEQTGVKLVTRGNLYELMGNPLVDNFMVDAPSGRKGITEIPHYDELNCEAGTMTIGFWLCLENWETGEPQTRAMRVLSKYEDASPDNTGRGFEVYIDYSNRLVFRVNAAVPQQDLALTSNTVLKPGVWTHVTCVLDGPRRQMNIYVNGELDARRSVTVVALRVNSHINLFLGRYGGYDSHVLQGVIDDVVISSEVLSPVDLMVSPHIPNSNTVLYMDFEELIDGKLQNWSPKGISGAVAIADEKTLVGSVDGFGRALRIGEY
ncbi:MAG: hypothetical protein PHV61_05575, partial [Limnochordia bacterium]|nr:hypothetical protein [Limnochordia bacterium]